MKDLIPTAVHLANEVHDGQHDKAGEPYIWHPLRVALAMNSDGEKIVALLHDVVEDTREESTGTPDQTLRYIYSAFGVGIGDAVKAITHRKNEPLDDYYERVKANPLALRVKIEDVWDNVGRLGELRAKDEETYRRLIKKYHHALTVLIGREPWGQDDLSRGTYPL